MDEKTKARRERIAKELEGLVDEGEGFLVKCEDEEITVLPATDLKNLGTSPLRTDQPELYGHLLSLNEALDRAGRLVNMVIWLAAVVLCAIIGMGWVDQLFGIETEKLQGIFTYVLIGAVTLFVTNRLGVAFERVRFARLRTRLQRAIGETPLSPAGVLATIEGDSSLSLVSKYLKRDVQASGRDW